MTRIKDLVSEYNVPKLWELARETSSFLCVGDHYLAQEQLAQD